MSQHWRREVLRTVWLVMGCFVLGAMTGEPWHVLAIGLLVYIIWMLLQLHRIDRWLLEKNHEEPPQTIGFWGHVCDKLYVYQRDEQRQKKRLQARTQYFKDSLSALHDGVVILNPLGDIDWLNQAAEHFLNLKTPSDVGQPLQHLVRAPAFLHYYEQGDYQDDIELENYGFPPKHLSLQVIRFGKGYGLVFIRDLTAIKRLEQMRKDFVSSISHELRTPLTVIKGYVELLQ